MPTASRWHFRGQLGQAGIASPNVSTTATVTRDKRESGFAVTDSHMDVTIKSMGADGTVIEHAALNA